MMNERRRKRHILKVDHYDGQSIYSGRKLFYELGGYLGGGAAGVVYEAFCARTHRHVAIKILNPVGYKLLPSTLLTRCIVAVRGKPLEPTNAYHDDHHEFHDEFSPFGRSHGTYGTQNGNGNVTPGGSNRFSSVATRMSLENVWWLIHPSTKQAVAAYEDPRTGMLRELSLPQCIDVWGAELRVDDCQDDLDSTFEQLEEAYQEVQVKGQTLKIPKIPKKFIKFALTRRTIHREIANMSGLGFHENVLRLEEALELVQDSKCTTFLVLELAAGGELFDRIKLDCGTDEDTARRYFQQLISGVAFCHSSGVCHRDLKPENLLLADTEEFSTLKIADFGLSAIFAMTEQGGAGAENSMGPDGSSSSAVQAIRRLRSVVGSPHYVAPEVLMDAGQGYDGAKADAWSIGVIVYAMLAGNLPFGKDLLKCLRYEKFKKWCYNTKYSDEDPVDEVAFPTWFFPAQFTLEVKSLITQLLYPDPSMRISVEEAQRHAWVLGQRLTRRANAINEENPETSPTSPSTISPRGNIVSPVLFREAPTAVSPNVIQRSTAASPGGYNRMHQGYNGRSTVNTPSGIGVSPSPQTAALRGHLINSGYMPSLDETSPLSSGNTPVQSPRCNHQDEEERNSGTTLQFDMDQPTQESTKRQSATSSETVKVEEEAELYSRECQPQPSLVRAPSSVSSLPPIAPSSASSLITDTQRASRRRFTSPPLATGSRCSLLERHHYQHRRNSPPELFLSRFGKGFKFEAIQTAFEDIDLEQFQASAINLASTPTESTLRQQSGRRPRFLSLSSSQSVPNTPMGASQSSPGENSQESSPVSSTPGTSDPPSYQTDLVARSTRFITALPAQLVLTKIETILMTNPTPRPSGSNRQGESPQQLVTIDWENYQMEVSYGDVLTCTVQVFLFQRGVYLVEFRRGQVEIFQFKRFYEDIREKLSDNMEMSVASPRSIQNVRNSDEDTLSGPSSQRQPRKRNNSLSAQEGLLK